MRYLLALLLAIAASPVFAQAPSTGYISGTPDAPSTDGETGFSFIVVIDSSFTDFWAEAENTNADRGRVYRNDGTTKLNCHWIKYDHSGQSAIIRFQDTAALSPTTYRVYPPVAANAQDDTSASAYDANWEGYWPLEDLTDAVAANDLTANNSPTSGATGKIGLCYSFDNDTGNQYLSGTAPSFDYDTCTIMAWANYDVSNNQDAVFGAGVSGSLRSIKIHNTANLLGALSHNGAAADEDTNATPADVRTITVFLHHAATFAAGVPKAYYNGTSDGTSIVARDPGTLTTMSIGARYSDGYANYFDGPIDEVQIHSVVRSDEWIAYEYAQTNDNAAFWNTWTWNAASSSSSQLLRTLLESQ